MTKYSPTIEKIHSEFNSAGNLLLEQAKGIINQVGEAAIQKAERLEKVGFIAAKEVEQLTQVKMSIAQANLIEFYRQKYPLYKFITDEQVNTICKKYNLVNAPISRYKGFVPETKLKQLESSNIDETDVAEDQIRITNCWNMRGLADITFMIGRCFSGHIIHKRIGKKTLSVNDPMLDWHRESLYAIRFDGLKTYVEKYRQIDKHSMTICAPSKDFELKGLNKSGLNFFSSKRVHIPDPVVLQPVKGGNLILAAWGDEASDPIVMNQINN